MNKKYREIKPTIYLTDYENLFKILKTKNISFSKIQKELNISEEDIQKIEKHELVDLSKIGKYLSVDPYKLYEINGKYDFTNDLKISKHCDELRSAGYTIEYRDLGYGGQFEFKMTKIGLYPPITINSSSFSIAIIDLYDRYTFFKKNGYYPVEFD